MREGCSQREGTIALSQHWPLHICLLSPPWAPHQYVGAGLASPRNQRVLPVWPCWFFASAPSPPSPGPLLTSRRPLEPKFLPQCFSVWLLPVYWSVNNLFNLICTAPKGNLFSNFSLDKEVLENDTETSPQTSEALCIDTVLRRMKKCISSLYILC